MAMFSLGQRTTDATISHANHEIRAGSSIRPKLMETSLTTTVATAQGLGLGRPAAQGLTPVNVLFQGDDSGDTSGTNSSLSWATSPTAPTIYHRRVTVAATVGAGYLYAMPRGIVIAASGSFVSFNVTAGQLSDIYNVIDE